jgi:hypothetical protein
LIYRGVGYLICLESRVADKIQAALKDITEACLGMLKASDVVAAAMEDGKSLDPMKQVLAARCLEKVFWRLEQRRCIS